MTEPAALKLKKWRLDPVSFVREVFKVEPDAWQVDVLKAFAVEQRIAMKACKGPGKTCVMAWCAWNYLATRVEPKVIATSVTKDNLSDGLWSEMAKWRNRSAFLTQEFTWTKTEIAYKEFPETWWMVARQWAKSATPDQQADTLAGKHADNMLFILDESGGIPDAVMAAAKAALANEGDQKIMQAGNPTHLEGPLYRACTSERDKWWVIEITGDPDDPKRSPRVSKEWAQDQIDEYGRNHPYVLVNVFGQFPPSSMNALLGPDEVAKAMKKHYRGPEFDHSQKRLGVDVARFGDDTTVLFPRQGLVAYRPVIMRNAASNEVAARVALAKRNWDSEVEFIDGTGGYGAGVIDFLNQGGHTPQEVQFAGKPDDPRYANKRAEMWFRMAEWIKRGGALPNDPELAKELTSVTYTYTTNGKFILEGKQQIKDRLGFSPDKADGLALTFAWAEMPSAIAAGNRLHVHLRSSKVTSDWDPFDESRL